MGHIRQRKLKNGNVRYQAEIRLKGHPLMTVVVDRRTDASNCGSSSVAGSLVFEKREDRYDREYAEGAFR